VGVAVVEEAVLEEEAVEVGLVAWVGWVIGVGLGWVFLALGLVLCFFHFSVLFLVFFLFSLLFSLCSVVSGIFVLWCSFVVWCLWEVIPHGPTASIVTLSGQSKPG